MTGPAFLNEPVDLKIERANHHREEVLAELEAFRNRKPYLVREHMETWEGRPYRVVTAYELEHPPDQLTLILGDFVQNLRASLDYLVGAMRADGPSQSSAFPICRTLASFSGKGTQQKLAGIPGPAKKLIQSMQPYARGGSRYRWRWKSLGLLETLWNIDKHRSVLLSDALVAPKYVGHNRTSEESAGIGFRTDATNREADIWLPVDDGDQHFDPHFGVDVLLAKPRGFADDWPRTLTGFPLDRLVDHLYQKVAWDVLPRFRRYIQPSN